MRPLPPSEVFYRRDLCDDLSSLVSAYRNRNSADRGMDAAQRRQWASDIVQAASEAMLELERILGHEERHELKARMTARIGRGGRRGSPHPVRLGHPERPY